MQLQTRFQEHRVVTSGFMALLPKFHEKYGWTELNPVVEHYHKFLNATISSVKGEYELWRQFWKGQ
jgi:hypothetical protein